MIGIYRRKSSKQYSEVLRIAQLPTFYEFSTDNEVVKRCARTVHLADYGFSTTSGQSSVHGVKSALRSSQRLIRCRLWSLGSLQCCYLLSGLLDFQLSEFFL
jgi:hypothetical protein